MVKALAVNRGVAISSHGELIRFVRKLGEEEKKPEFRRLFAVVSALHQNLYENWVQIPYWFIKIDVIPSSLSPAPLLCLHLA